MTLRLDYSLSYNYSSKDDESNVLKINVQERSDQQTKEKLVDLIQRINQSISEITQWEEALFCKPHQFFEDSKYHFSPSEKTQSIMSYKKALKKDVRLLGEEINRYSKMLGPIPYSHKEKISAIITYLSKGFIPLEGLKNASLLRGAFTRLLLPLLKSSPLNLESTLIPSSFYGKRKKTKLYHIKIEETFNFEQQAARQRIFSYLKNCKKEALSFVESKIFRFMEGLETLENLELTPENARSYLMTIKLIDLTIAEYNRQTKNKVVFPETSYLLRTRVLELCSPVMRTSEAYTKTLDPKKMKDRLFLSFPNHWVPERIGHQAKVVANQIALSAHLSQRLNHYQSSVWAVRANTGCGKSRAISQDDFFRKAMNESGEMHGVLNPDLMKYHLKKKQKGKGKAFLINNQVHEEGVALFKKFLDGIKETNSSFLIEGRFSTIEEVNLNVIKFAQKREGEILLLDIESPLITSLNRVLTRNPYGIDPCPPLLDIIKGYKQSIQYRDKLIEIVKKEPSIKFFKLYFYDHFGVCHLVAEKKDENFKILSQDLLKVSCTLPADDEIQQQVNQVISPQYIEKALQRKDISENSRHLLECWIGLPIAKAIEMHALGIPLPLALEKIKEEKIWKERYGCVEQQPFNGSWLHDFPQIIQHLKSEQLLHIRGTDEEGYGLHWQTNKFSWNLNPQFNPETKIGHANKAGFQMRIGYFVVPPSKIDKLNSQNISFTILKDLEVKNEVGELIGYRFFVHPEAYHHFKSLHEANIPFVQPQQSEFIGTPTSSYRSLAIRRVLKKEDHFTPIPNTIPFIVKLGVASSTTDVSKLLPRETIEKSLKNQMLIDEMSKNPNENQYDLRFFSENCGLILKDIPHYPPKVASGTGDPIDSGIIIREFPAELLRGKCQIFSFSALISVERSKKELNGLCSLDSKNGLQSLPLIYEIMHASIKKGLVNNPKEFFKTYLIKGYLKAIEKLHFHKGFPFAPHGQNLCMIVNPDFTPLGFAYRDLEGLSHEKQMGYIETFSWFYRYHNFIKLLNVVTNVGEISLRPPAGAPTQAGYVKKLKERNLHYYLFKKLEKEKPIQIEALKALMQFSLTTKQYHQLLKLIDQAYLSILARYFSFEEADFVMEDGCLPAAESGSIGEDLLLKLNSQLWKHRYEVVPCFDTKKASKKDKIHIFDPKKKRELWSNHEFLNICKRFIENGNYDPRQSLQILSSESSFFTQSKTTPNLSSKIKEIQEWHQTLLNLEKNQRIEKARKALLGSIRTLHDLKWKFYSSFNDIPNEFLSYLLRTAKYGKSQEVEFIIKSYADCNHKEVQDALCVAIMFGQLEVVKLLFKKGTNLSYKRHFDFSFDSYFERFTPMGHAIQSRCFEVIEFLVDHGCKIDHISHDDQKQVALELFFQCHRFLGSDPRLLSLILTQHSTMEKINHDTLFNIAVYSSVQELKLLLDAGLNPQSLWRKEENSTYKGNTQVGYLSEVNLLDLAVIQAEKENLFHENPDSIEKVRLLIQRGADPKKCNNFCNQNYLHHVRNPQLVKLFCQSGVDATAEALADKYACKDFIRPIDWVYQIDLIKILCAHGENWDRAPYLKGTLAHKQALERIGFREGNSFDLKEGIRFLIAAIELVDIPAVIALLGEGVNVNQRTNSGLRWTALHHLFSNINHSSISPEYDFLHLAEDNTLRLINLLIKKGALPLKDDAGRTPLMCLTFHPFGSGCNHYIIDQYISFEANFYGLDVKEYRKKFNKLREGGYQSVEIFPGRIETGPIFSKFNDFWQSFKNQTPFDPPKSHFPEANWYKLKAIFKD